MIVYIKNLNRIFCFSLCLIIIQSVFCHLYAQNTKQDAKDITEDSSGAYYIIKKGDTLWDLSRKFLNSPWSWPELWQMNSDVPITNPHLIYPGQRIRLVKRAKSSLPPAALSPFTPIESPNQAVSTNFQPSDVKSDTIASSGYIEELPPTEEEYEKGTYYLYSLINQVGFVKKDPVKASGAIFKVKDDKEMISKGDIVFITSMNNTSFELGKYYTIYRKSENPIRDQKTKALIGTQHIILGSVEIIRVEEEFVMAKVTKSFRDIKVNDLLMPYEKRLSKIVFTQSIKGLTGSVIASEEGASIMGEHSIAFIDKGQEHGIKPGQLYKVFHQETAQPDPAVKKRITLPPADFATLLVLITTPTTSTVLVNYSEKSIHPGAKFHSP